MQINKPITKPTKQRKAVYQAPDHRRHKLFAAPLSSTLKATHGVRSFPVRSGDTVRVMRGDHEGFEGKISRIDLMKYRVYIEGLTREKVDGTAIFVSVHPSKVMITNLNLDDKWRKKLLERKKKMRKETEAEEKPVEKLPRETTKIKEVVVKEKMPAEEKPPEKKPKREKKKIVKKTVAKKEKQAEETPKEEKKPKTKKPKTKRKAAEKTEGET
ncbi:MAG TPA: 50S ribosomal protein L24 [Candidatus Bathyarchaeia archaeon]|nr:50S ribosomal protein L24 [Candidatus Bathyarchaeia archaeon]